ncbi:MAG: deoxycytidine triphosphate deaminase [Snowella sp.]|nr:deoxycytidine triphosphate deaminase [Snowella sp.]
MTALSDQDIKRELGKNIAIYPFDGQNVKNASYNFTASKLAWSLETKESIYQVDESDPESSGKLIILPNTTALIETNETIWISSKLCGAYHSKVAWVSKGLGHIGTTLDPAYIGPSLITVHNHSSETIEIVPEKDTFVSLMFFYVKTKSSCLDNNSPGRPEILKDYKLSSIESQWFDEPFRKYVKPLKLKMKQSLEYQNFKKNWIDYFLITLILAGVLLLKLIIFTLLIYYKSNLDHYPWYNTIVNGLSGAKNALIAALIVQFGNNLATFKNEIKENSEIISSGTLVFFLVAIVSIISLLY